MNNKKNRTDNLNKKIEKGETLELNGMEISLKRISNIKYSRNTIYANNTLVGAIERTIGQDVPVATNNLSFVSSLRLLSIASTNINDTAAGTGGRTILIVGLDFNFNTKVETISLNGRTPVNTINQYLRINEMILSSSGSLNTNQGIIYCSDSTDTFSLGVPQNRVYDIMDISNGLSKTGIYTIPNGFKMIGEMINISTNATETKPAVIKVYRTDNVNSDISTEILFDTIYLAGNVSYDTSDNFAFSSPDNIRITAKSSGGSTIEVALKYDTISLNLTK
tara:strand:- start:2034 stop:2870 length:837 start_codon:yes stop_codon:yes gene_type:complete